MPTTPPTPRDADKARAAELLTQLVAGLAPTAAVSLAGEAAAQLKQEARPVASVRKGEPRWSQRFGKPHRA